MKDGGRKGDATIENPQGLPLKADGSVDIDKIRLKLLFICRAKPPLEVVANYLTRRGWETVVTREMVEAFKIVSTFKPDFVLVSVNIQSPKLPQLPTVLYQTFKVPVIIFGESLNTKTLKGLQTIVANHKMPGALSGPSVHRRLKQILQDMYAPEAAISLEAEEQNNGSVTNQEGKGKKKGAFGKATVSDDEADSNEKQSEMMRFSKDEEEKGSGLYMPDGESEQNPKSAKRSANDRHKSKDGSDGDVLDGEEEDLDFAALAAQYGATKQDDEPTGGVGSVTALDESKKREAANSGPNKAANSATENSQADAKTATEGGEKKRKLIYQKSAPKAGANANRTNSNVDLEDAGKKTESGKFQQGEANPTDGMSPEELADFLAGHPKAEAEQKAVDKKTSSVVVPQGNAPDQNTAVKQEESQAIFKAIQEIAKISILPLETGPEKHRTVFECTVFSVKIAAQTVYAMIFVEGAVHDEIQFISRFHANLVEKLPMEVDQTSVSEPVRFAQQFKAEMLQNSVEKPTAATFSLRSGRGNVHFVLVGSEQVTTKIGPALDGQKAQITPEDLVADLPVGVDVFLFLPKNNKYFLYLKPESSIAKEQKDRFSERKAKLYISKDDIESFKESLKRNKTMELIITPKKKVA